MSLVEEVPHLLLGKRIGDGRRGAADWFGLRLADSRQNFVSCVEICYDTHFVTPTLYIHQSAAGAMFVPLP
jgi:hypothetical protein